MDKENIPVLYPFGYGLSYTSFDLGVPQIEVFNETAKVRINVKNTGVRKGAEVVQLYVGCEDSRVDRPAKILKDFQRVELEPGEEKEVVLKVAMEDMAYYCEEIDAFVKEDVTYIAYTGNSSSAGELQKTTFTFT